MTTNKYVAVSHIRFGAPDGTLVTFEPGEPLEMDEDVTPELVQEWFEAGNVTVEGWADDPNLLKNTVVNNLTPAMIEAGLTDNYRAAHGPAPADHQKALLDSVHADNVPSTVPMDPGTVSPATTPKTPLPEGAVVPEKAKPSAPAKS